MWQLEILDWLFNTCYCRILQFAGEAGEEFSRVIGKFCSNQNQALDALRHRQRTDPRFAAYMQERNADPLCRRLELKDLLPTVMQRLTKYPLLIESVLKNTTEPEEYERLQKAAECTKKVLANVNRAVRDCENKLKLKKIQDNLEIDRRLLQNNPQLAKEYRVSSSAYNIEMKFR